MPNNEDEWIDELLDGYELGTVLPDRVSALSADEAKATIQAKLLEARLDEVQRMSQEAAQHHDYMLPRSTIIGRIAQLQASAPTKKEGDHE